MNKENRQKIIFPRVRVEFDIISEITNSIPREKISIKLQRPR